MSTWTDNYTQQSRAITPGMTLTNANRQRLRVVPWNSHSALVLSTLALLVALEGEIYCPTTTSYLLIYRITAVIRHQLALWVVPPYWSRHWSCGLQTVHSLPRSDGQRHVRMWVKQASAAILQVSSRHWSERRCKEEERLRQSTIVYSVCCLPRTCSKYYSLNLSNQRNTITNLKIYLSIQFNSIQWLMCIMPKGTRARLAQCSTNTWEHT